MNRKELALEAFSSEAFLVVNKRLLRAFGPDRAIFISNLIDKYKYFEERGELRNGKWFFLTFENQLEQTHIKSKKVLRKIKKEFIEMGIIKTEIKCAPPKEFYKLDINELLDKIQISEVAKKEPLKVTKGNHSYKETKDNNTIKKKLNKKEKKIISLKQFIDMFPELYSKIPLRELERFYEYRTQVCSKRKTSPFTQDAGKHLINKMIRANLLSDEVVSEFQRSINNNWVSIFPKETKSNKLQTIKDNLMQWYKTCRDHHPNSKDYTPGPKQFMTMYEKWLDRQDWLDNKEGLHLYLKNGKVFKIFYKEFLSEFRYDIIKGRRVG